MIGRRFAAATALAVAAVLAPVPAAGQLSGSPSFQLDALTFDGGGGGLCSGAFAALVAQPALAPHGGLTSAGFGAELGFLTIVDPLATDQPALFAVDPPHGPTAGGAITLCGIHLDRAGLAAPQSGTVGGQPLTGVTILSDTTVTATVPPGANGPEELVFTTSAGASALESGYVYSPAITASPLAYRGGGLRIVNYGVPGTIFDVYLSPVTTNLPIPGVGTLLIGPTPLYPVLFLGGYDPATGIDDAVLPLPTDPVLSGLTFYFQSVLLSLPFQLQLVNRAETLIQ